MSGIWRKHLDYWAARGRHLLGAIVNQLVVRLAACQRNGFHIRGEGWRACWMGPERADRDCLRQVIDETCAKVLGVLQEEFGVGAVREELFLFCGAPEKTAEITRPVRRIGRRKPRELPTYENCFLAPNWVVVTVKPASPVFQQVLAHELCHAFGHRVRGGPAAPWISEGAAGLVAERIVPANELLTHARLHGMGDDFRLPIPLRAMLTAEIPAADSSVQWLLTAQATAFLQFLAARRTECPFVWEPAQRAFIGREPEATLAPQAFEHAFGAPLEDIEREFCRYCSDILRAMSAVYDSQRRQLLSHTGKGN